jgi:hypothetical protein
LPSRAASDEKVEAARPHGGKPMWEINTENNSSGWAPYDFDKKHTDKKR